MKNQKPIKNLILKKNLVLLINYTTLAVLILLLAGLVFPLVPTSSHATCANGDTLEECMSMPISTEVGITTDTVISLALDNQVQMEITPKSNGATSYASTKLSVSTNSNDGYAIYMQAGSETGNLTGVTNNLNEEINNTTQNSALLDNLESNSYGYALSETAIDSNTLYSHVPTTNTIIKSTTSSAKTDGEYSYGDTYHLAFGTKVGTNLPAGTYSGTITVSAVANPITLRSMYDLTYMQDMTHDICENTKEHYTKQLIDTRDGKSYWVAKLKDGNCWMTQNLALDIALDDEGNAAALSESGSKVVLDSSNTSIMEEWGGNSSYPPKATNNYPLIGESVAHAPYTDSWDLGEIVIITPGFKYGVDLRSTGQISDFVTLVEVSGGEWKPTFVARNKTITREDFVRKTVSESDGTTKVIYVPRSKAASENADKDEAGNYIPFTYTGLVTADLVAKTYDAHYLLGNYYQWYTSAAGTDPKSSTVGNIVNGSDISVTKSICPRGWRLSLNGKANNLVDGSYYNMLRWYGLQVSVVGALEKLISEPLYFVPGGLMFSTNGNIGDVGGLGYYGGGTFYTGGTNGVARFLAFGEGSWVDASYGPYGADLGSTIRCLTS